MDRQLLEALITKSTRHVYASCDTSNENSVPASKLLEFINGTDFANRVEFLQLEGMLDPNRTNPSLTCDEFLRVVMEWAHENSSNLRWTNEEMAMQVFEEDAAYNSGTCDREEFQTLESKYTKAITQISDLKLQLAAAEEQNELLSNENDKIAKLMRAETSNKNKEELCDDVECVAEVRLFYEKEVVQLRKSATIYETEITKLNDSILNHIEEKKMLQDKVKHLDEKVAEQLRILREVDIRSNEMEKEIALLNDTNSQLRSKLQKQEETFTSYTDRINLLKTEKTKLVESVQEYVLDCSYTNQTNPVRRKRLLSSVQTPLSGRILDILNFNSPDLMFKLENPVSPGLGSSFFGGINNNVEIISPLSQSDNDDNVFMSADNNYADCENEEISNMSDVCLESSLKALSNGRRASLCDEILLADQDFHRTECLQLIAKQKCQITEQEETIEQLTANIAQLSERVDGDQKRIETLISASEEREKLNAALSDRLEENRRCIEGLILEKEEMLAKFNVAKAASEDQASLPPNTNKNARKQSNFGKMELKLERRDAKIEELNKALMSEREKCESILNENRGVNEALKVMTDNYNKLTEEMVKVNEEKREYKLKHSFLVKSFKLIRKLLNLKMPSDTLTTTEMEASKLEQLVDQIPGTPQSTDGNLNDSNSELYKKLASAFTSDVKTIDDRLKTRETLIHRAQQVLVDMFVSLQLVMNSVAQHLPDHCEQQLGNGGEFCANAIKFATDYGKLRHECSQLKLLGVIIAHNRNLECTFERKIEEYKTVCEKKTVSACRRITTCLSFIVFVLFVYLVLSNVCDIYNVNVGHPI